MTEPSERAARARYELYNPPNVFKTPRWEDLPETDRQNMIAEAQIMIKAAAQNPKPISYGFPDAWGGANIRAQGVRPRIDHAPHDHASAAEWQRRQNIINCYASEQMSERQWIERCNADPALLEMWLKMWEAQRDDK